jgi:hypothetical protein
MIASSLVSDAYGAYRFVCPMNVTTTHATTFAVFPVCRGSPRCF